MRPLSIPFRISSVSRTPLCSSLLLAFLALTSACIDRQSAQRAIEGIQSANGQAPDQMPVMLNRDPPFRYPLELYASKVQGNVTLRIRIDTTGTVLPESTTVAESSGYPGLDSAAVKGSQELRFSPARLRGKPIAVSFLLPVFFRHPKGHPLPGDTILRKLGARQPAPAPHDSTH